MRVFIAMDSFKGNLTSLEVAGVVEEGIRKVYPDAQVEKSAVADGGEGTVKALVECFRGRTVMLDVMGPFGKKVRASYGIIDGNTAVMEMAEASGIVLADSGELNPMLATTYGTGEMIEDALARGCRKIIMGIGGSATNDAGQGMAAALGARFLDKEGKEVGLGGKVLRDIADIDVSGLDKRVAQTEFVIACDVQNPLYGPKGAAFVFGPQKGADDAMARELDEGLKNFAHVVKAKIGVDINTPGSGAAGGLGGGLKAFCGAKLGPGIEIIMEASGIEKRLAQADIVITGEGRVDDQTAYGKVPSGIARLGKKHGKPVFAIAGYAGARANEVYGCGIDAVVSSITAPIDNDEAIRNSVPMIRDAAERLFRTIRAVRKE